ncbi:PREDICTED: uncharacterized protein LOC104598124 [Nelumbo nucifera]|uniref:Uncharacterized protein LOC104598124 n=1 Tax=Nelumbo nucifera TaxID=4432 RepID=A0A1U8A9U4_NELNU|nr:PREDICTED: uncharacterized protein LOC104598124 [Nelumbo nucifera]
MTDMPLEIGAVNPKSNVSEQEPMGEGKKPEFNGDQSSTKISNDDTKRPREGSESEEEDEISKKQKIEKLVEEECLDKLQQNEEEEEVKEAEKEEEKKTEPVSVGPKNFSSSEEIFNYFYKFLHCWPPNVNVNQYEHMMLLNLLEKGHADAERKLGGGVDAFQVRYHPLWKKRCFFLIRQDESVDDFSFRKCIDHILPLPESMKVNSDVNKVLGGSKGGRHQKVGGRCGRGSRRGNWSRN